MTLQQLKYVVAIADHGLNISRAARHLYTSQPGISKQLKLLEDELGVRLFEREGRSLVASTSLGERVVAHARVIFDEVKAIRRISRDVQGADL